MRLYTILCASVIAWIYGVTLDIIIFAILSETQSPWNDAMYTVYSILLRKVGSGCVSLPKCVSIPNEGITGTPCWKLQRSWGDWHRGSVPKSTPLCQTLVDEYILMICKIEVYVYQFIDRVARSMHMCWWSKIQCTFPIITILRGYVIHICNTLSNMCQSFFTKNIHWAMQPSPAGEEGAERSRNSAASIDFIHSISTSSRNFSSIFTLLWQTLPYYKSHPTNSFNNKNP